MLFIARPLLNSIFLYYVVFHHKSKADIVGTNNVGFRILRGVPEIIEDRPYAASVFDFDHQRLIGTGTVLSVNYVITAAHLFNQKCLDSILTNCRV
jgi:hypothetical protein